MALVFFDQNVMDKMLKKKYQSFQNNVDILRREINYSGQLLTPFSLLEFAGYDPKETPDIQYQGKKFTDFSFPSYDDFNNKNMVKHLEEQFYQKVTKNFLKEILEKKKNREKDYFNEEGFRFIEEYIEKIDLFYEDIINYLLLEQLSQINTSKFSEKDRYKYIGLCSRLVIDFACKKHSLGSFRVVLKLYDEWRKQPIPQKIKENPELLEVKKHIPEILGKSKLKSKKDRVDCEMIHLAFFGWEHKPCHIYTTDNKNLITHRLHLYHALVNVIIQYFFEYQPTDNDKTLSQILKKNETPEWKCGKIFILNRETGEKIKKISVTKIYEGKTNYQFVKSNKKSMIYGKHK